MNFEFDDDQIDIKEIMKEIKLKAEKRQIPSEIDDVAFLANKEEFPSLEYSQLEKHQHHLNRNWNYSGEFPITSHRKVLGPLIIFVKKIIRKLTRWYINPIIEKQVIYNANVTQGLNEVINNIKLLNSNYNQIADEIEYLHAKRLNTSKEKILDIKNKVKQDIVSKIEEYEEELHSSVHDEVDKKIQSYGDQLRSEINHLKQIIEQIERLERIGSERLRRIERSINASEKLKFVEESFQPHIIDPSSNVHSNEFDYYLFEELYRGSREEIKERQKQYLEFFIGKDNVLDLGCGRGEFIELLLENNISVSGVEINDDMLAYCRERGFPVIKKDLLDYLKEQSDNSVGGIFLGQVIEHLSSEQLIYLVKEAYRVLKPTSWIIAETPNPRTLSVFTGSFYMDITHTKPVHPETAKFIFNSAGFHTVDIGYASPNPEYVKLPQLKSDAIENIDEFNAGIQRINGILYGDLDYYIAAKK